MRIDSREHHAAIQHSATQQGATHSSSIPSPEKPVSNPDLPHVRVRVRGLGDGEHPIDFTTDAGALDYEPFANQARIHGTLVRTGEQFHLKATASAEGAFECTRCSDPFSRVIDAPLDLEFVPPRLVRDPSDPNVHEYDSGLSPYIDITEDVRDGLALAIPMIHLCRPDCKGLCPVCGKDLNLGPCGHLEPAEEDAKFPALKSLRERLRAEEGTAGAGKP